MNESKGKYINTTQRMDEAPIERLKSKYFEHVSVQEICKRQAQTTRRFICITKQLQTRSKSAMDTLITSVTRNICRALPMLISDSNPAKTRIWFLFFRNICDRILKLSRKIVDLYVWSYQARPWWTLKARSENFYEYFLLGPRHIPPLRVWKTVHHHHILYRRTRRNNKIIYTQRLRDGRLMRLLRYAWSA